MIRDRKIFGNSTPRFRFGINLGLEWKRIRLQHVLARSSQTWSWLWQEPCFGDSGGEWQSTGLKEHWIITVRKIQIPYLVPILMSFPQNLHGKRYEPKVQSRYPQNGAYARLKNIQIGYTLPKQLISKLCMQNLRVFVSAENVLTISSLPSGFDPETTFCLPRRISGKTYPLQSTISFGINATF